MAPSGRWDQLPDAQVDDSALLIDAHPNAPGSITKSVRFDRGESFAAIWRLTSHHGWRRNERDSESS